MEHLLITGANGWLGRNLIEDLRARRDLRRLTLVCGPRTSEKERREIVRLSEGLDRSVCVIDLTAADTPSTLRRLAPTQVIHTAANIHPTNARGFKANVVMVENLLAGVSQETSLVHVSSAAAVGTGSILKIAAGAASSPYMAYGRSKNASERIVARSGRRAVVIRACWCYGPHAPKRQERMISACVNGRFPLPDGGRPLHSLTYMPDLARACLLALDESSIGVPVWHIADKRPYSLAEIAAAASVAGGGSGTPGIFVPKSLSAVARGLDVVVQGVGKHRQELHVLGELGLDVVLTDLDNERLVLSGADLVAGFSEMMHGK